MGGPQKSSSTLQRQLISSPPIRPRRGGRLPRLAIIGDIRVEQTAGGSLLLYRLLQQYPPDDLLLVYNSACPKQGDPSKRLPGIRHVGVPCPVPQSVRGRLLPAWSLLLPRLLRKPTADALAIVREFDPEAILTIPYDFFWLAADRIARALGIPLHLIVHDDWASTVTANRGGPIGRLKRGLVRRVMGPVYRQAASRLCVSPGMIERYRAWFGVGGDVLYPSRGEDSPEARVRVRSAPTGPPVVAYCGLIHQAGTAHLLRELAGVLRDLNGVLDYYGPYSADFLARTWRLSTPTVRVAGFLPAREMGERVARTAHAVFLPASFEPRERDDVTTLFPSKLADYTAIGLPVLMWGPVYSSAARWAAENPGAALCVTDPDPTAVRAAVRRLTDDREYATQVAAAGVEAGNRYFGLVTAREVFLAAITKAGGSS